MPPRKRSRPSFSPEPDAEAPAATGWVYRSDESTPSPPPEPPTPTVETSVAEAALALPAAVQPEKPAGWPRWAPVLRALTVPFTLLIVTSMPAAQAFSRRRV